MLTAPEALLLAYLNVLGAATTYALSRRIATSPLHCLNLTTPALYPIVRSLSERNLIGGEEVADARRRAKTVWSLTAKGRAAFLGWVAAPSSVDEYRTLRPAFEIKCAYSPLLDPEARRSFVSRQTAVLEGYRQELTRFVERHGGSAAAQVYGTTVTQIELDCAMLRRLAPTDGKET